MDYRLVFTTYIDGVNILPPLITQQTVRLSRKETDSHDVTLKVKVDAPDFDGRLDPSAFLDWIVVIEFIKNKPLPLVELIKSNVANPLYLVESIVSSSSCGLVILLTDPAPPKIVLHGPKYYLQQFSIHKALFADKGF